MGWNCLSVPKLQRLHPLKFGNGSIISCRVYNERDHLSLLELKVIHVSKMDPDDIRSPLLAKWDAIRYRYSTIDSSNAVVKCAWLAGAGCYRQMSMRGIHLIKFWLPYLIDIVKVKHMFLPDYSLIKHLLMAWGCHQRSLYNRNSKSARHILWHC